MAITMPAMAPPDIELEGEEGADAEAELEVVDENEEVVPMLEEPVDRDVDEVVAVTAINLRGSKVYELAVGLAEDREEYNEFNEPLLIFVRVSWAEDQHIFIWPLVWVHISLQYYISVVSRCRIR